MTITLISPNRRRTVEVMDGDTEALWEWTRKGFTVEHRVFTPAEAEDTEPEPEPIAEGLPTVETPAIETPKPRKRSAKK